MRVACRDTSPTILPSGPKAKDRLAHVIEEIAQAFSGRFQALLAVGDGVAHGVERAAELTDFVARLDVDARIEFSFFEAPRSVGDLRERLDDLMAGR